MKQTSVRSKTGVATKFETSRVIRIQSLNHLNFYRVVDGVKPGARYENETLALVETKQQEVGGRFRTLPFLKAVIVGPTLWDSVAASTLNADVIEIVDDKVLALDRFTRLASRVAPTQRLHKDLVAVPSNGIVVVDPFLAATLVASATPTAVNAANGQITFNVSLAGTAVEIQFVTEPRYPVFKIVRTATQPAGSLTGAIAPEVLAYVMSPSLAAALSLTLPPIG